MPSLKNILFGGCLAWSAVFITVVAGSDLPAGPHPPATASASTPRATPEQVLTRLDQILADKKLGQKGARVFLDEIKKRLGAAAASGEWPHTFRQMESRIQSHESSLPGSAEPLILSVTPEDVLVLLGERLQRYGLAGGRLIADQVKVALGNRAGQGDWPQTLQEIERRLAAPVAGPTEPSVTPPLSTATVPPHTVTPQQVLTQLDKILADKKLGQRGARTFLEAVKKNLGTAATQGEWPSTLRQMERRINNHANGI